MQTTSGPSQPFIRFTIFENLDGALSKRIALDLTGAFVKTGATQLTRGHFTTAMLPFAGDPMSSLLALGPIISQLSEKQAIATGRYRDDAVTTGTVVSKATLVPGAVARTAENFIAERGCGLLLIDGDGVTNLRPRLVSVWPDFVRVATLTRPSASAGIHNIATGEAMPAGGEHVYVVVSEAHRGKEVLQGIDRLCWAAGEGRIELARNGDMLERSLVDITVWAPSRLIYEGAVVLGAGLVQQPRRVELFPGGTLDVDEFLTFVAKQASADKVAATKVEAKRDPKLLERQAITKQVWAKAYAARLAGRGVDPEVAARNAALMSSGGGWKGTITGSDVFIAHDGSEIPISEILLDPGRFDGVAGPDPIEGPDYGRTTARIMASSGKPGIFSYAHGPGVYRLVHDAMSIASALVARQLTVPEGFITAMRDAVTTTAEDKKLIRAVARVFPRVTAVGFEAAVAAARENARHGPELTTAQKQLYEASKDTFDKAHHREGRVGAIAAVEAQLAGAELDDAKAILGKVIFFIASRGAASGARRPALERLVMSIAPDRLSLIDKAIAQIAANPKNRAAHRTRK